MMPTALSLYLRPAGDDILAERKAQFPGPYRAMSAYKGDEEKGERDWPWIVVGSSGVNIFGRLWDRAYAQAVAKYLNGEHP